MNCCDTCKYGAKIKWAQNGNPDKPICCLMRSRLLLKQYDLKSKDYLCEYWKGKCNGQF